MKKVFIVFMLGILYLPFVLGMIAESTSLVCDVELKGYTDAAAEPHFTLDSFWNGNYQREYAAWFEANMKPRGGIVRTYSSIRYDLFGLGNRPIGYHKDVFEWGYINSELCINGAQDLSVEENREKMQEYVQKLEQLQDKLAKHGKSLYIYITPSKADFHYDNVLDKYKDIADAHAVKPVDYFTQLMAESDVPCLICRDKRDELEYPAFYTTGIHWSRTYEQLMSAYMLDEVSELTGKRYRRLLLGDVQQSGVPYWRDADVYDLLNVWNKIDGETYYEYAENREYPDAYDKIRLMVQGTSFAEGIRYDIMKAYPYEDVYYIKRDEMIIDLDGNIEVIDSWDTFDVGKYLDHVDVLLLEETEAELTRYSFGFVEYLLDYLDTYEDQQQEPQHAKSFDCLHDDAWMTGSVKGIGAREDDFAWALDYCEINLAAGEPWKEKLEIAFEIPPEIFAESQEPDTVTIYLNGEKAYQHEYTEPWDGSVLLDAPDCGDGVCRIEIYCDRVFNPKQMGINGDERNLALKLKYAGRAR